MRSEIVPPLQCAVKHLKHHLQTAANWNPGSNTDQGWGSWKSSSSHTGINFFHLKMFRQLSSCFQKLTEHILMWTFPPPCCWTGRELYIGESLQKVVALNAVSHSTQRCFLSLKLNLGFKQEKETQVT